MRHEGPRTTNKDYQIQSEAAQSLISLIPPGHKDAPDPITLILTIKLSSKNWADQLSPTPLHDPGKTFRTLYRFFFFFCQFKMLLKWKVREI